MYKYGFVSDLASPSLLETVLVGDGSCLWGKDRLESLEVPEPCGCVAPQHPSQLHARLGNRTLQPPSLATPPPQTHGCPTWVKVAPFPKENLPFGDKLSLVKVPNPQKGEYIQRMGRVQGRRDWCGFPEKSAVKTTEERAGPSLSTKPYVTRTASPPSPSSPLTVESRASRQQGASERQERNGKGWDQGSQVVPAPPHRCETGVQTGRSHICLYCEQVGDACGNGKKINLQKQGFSEAAGLEPERGEGYQNETNDPSFRLLFSLTPVPLGQGLTGTRLKRSYQS